MTFRVSVKAYSLFSMCVVVMQKTIISLLTGIHFWWVKRFVSLQWSRLLSIQNSIHNFIFAVKFPSIKNFPSECSTDFQSGYGSANSQSHHQMSVFGTHFINIFISFLHQIWDSIVMYKNNFLSESVCLLEPWFPP